jgi:phosphotriesterase-related protein
MTVKGPVSSSSLGQTLIHEHILVDFIGAEAYDAARWNDDEVTRVVLPFLQQAKAAGCQTFVDCTPAYLGRDVSLLSELSMRSGLHIITNTGYYGGSDTKYLPAHAFTETADQLAERWIQEYEKGIDGSDVRPGFIKTSINNDHLTPVSQKLIRASARCHSRTGLTIAAHTGPATPAFEAMDILREEGVSPEAFIWVHAQEERDWSRYVAAARAGAWVSLDNLGDDTVPAYADRVLYLKKEKCLQRVLLSHDAGWYDPAKTGGGTLRPYTTLFTKLIPELKKRGVTVEEIDQLVRYNPAEVFRIGVRRF